METDNAKARMEALMLPLRRKYLAHLEDRRLQLKRFLSGTDKNLKELEFLAHKLSGSGETYGFKGISTAASELENRLITSAPDWRATLESLIHSVDNALLQRNDLADVPEQEADTTALADEFPLILLVDDDLDMHRVFQSIFAKKANIIVADSAKAARWTIENRNPDLIFLDDQMPGLTGLELMESLEKSGGIRAPVIMLTASAAPEKVMRGLASGAVEYMTKPFDPATLLDKAMQRISRGKITVMIVDDDAPVRDLLAHKFKTAGCRVITAIDGNAALVIMKETPPHLALLDRMMPGLDGLVVLQKMQEDKNLAEVPVVFLTVRHQESAVLEGLNMGAADYIVKPFNPEEVVARCMRLVRKKKVE